MSVNMSYCRFQNTLEAMREVEEDLANMQSLDGLSSEERNAARRLLKLCGKLASEWEGEWEMEP